MPREAPDASRFGGTASAVGATAVFVAIALALAGPALTGRTSLGPDRMLDFDPLYGSRHRLTEALPTMNDPTPIALDWPRDVAIARGLHAGRLDQWNPLAGCGAPLWAEQGGPFFPLKAAFYASPSREMYNVFLALRAAVAALGAYLLARQRGLAFAGALAAGVTFELCSPLIYQLRFGVYSNTFVLPWVVLASETLAARRTAAATGCAALVLGLAASAGHPSLAFLAFGAFAAAMATRAALAWRQPRTLLVTCGLAAIAGLLGAALAAPTLLPLVELMRIGSTYKTDPTFQPGGLDGGRLMLPFMLFGSDWRGSALGVFSVVAAMTGVVTGGLDAPLAAIGLLGLTVSSPPIGLEWIRDHTYLRYILSLYAWPLVLLPLTQAAGRGVEMLTSLKPRRIVLASASSLIACLAIWIVCGVDPLEVLPGRAFLQLLVPPAAAVGILSLGFALRRSRLARWFGPALILAIVCERLLADTPQLRQPASAVLTSPPPPAVRFLQSRLAAERARMVGVPHRVGYPLTPMLFGLPDMRNFSALPVRRYLEYIRAASPAEGGPGRSARKAKASLFDLAPLMVVQHVPFARSALLDLASVRFVAVPRAGADTAPRALEEDPELTLAYADEQVLIYENHAALPRVRVVHEAIRVADEIAAVSWAREQGASPKHAGELGLDKTVILEPDERGQYPHLAPGDGSPGEYARIADETDPDRVTVEAHLDSPGLIVLSDTFYPGWRAWVDDVPASIHPADLLFRAVSVPPGTHVVTFRYLPRSFSAGVLLFFLSAATCGTLLIGSSRCRFFRNRGCERGHRACRSLSETAVGASDRHGLCPICS